MKAMKKIGAAALALAMLGTSMSSMAFAEEAEEESYDFGGAIVKVYGNQWGKLDPDSTDDNSLYLDYAKQVEEKYNIKFEYSDAADQGYDGYDIGDVISTTLTSGECFANIIDMGPDQLISLIAGGYLSDITEHVDELKVGSVYTDAVTWAGKCYGMTFDNIGDTYALVYSRDLLNEIGMDETPTEKFMNGEWSYDEMKEYLTEMKAKLDEGLYPIAVHYFHWQSMSGAANGAVAISSDGVVNIKTDAYLESLEFYRDLIDNGLAHPIELTFDADGNLTDEVTVYQHSDLNTKMVMTMSESWQFGSLAGSIGEWGLTYWPWGDEVTVDKTAEEDIYTTLSDNYKISQSYWGNCVVPSDAEKQTGIEPIVLMKIAQDYYDLCSPAGAACRAAAYEAEQAGETPAIGFSYGEARDFCSEEDIELYDWGHSRVVYDWSKAFNDSGTIRTWRLAREVIGQGNDARSAAESYYNAGIEILKEMGLDVIDGSTVVEEEVVTEESTEE